MRATTGSQTTGTVPSASGSTNPTENAATPEPDPAFLMQLFAARAKRDHEAMMYYAAALAGIMGLFIISHFVRLLVQKTRLQLGLFALSAPFLNVAR